jgi:sugar lactone lactonase YvrE
VRRSGVGYEGKHRRSGYGSIGPLAYATVNAPVALDVAIRTPAGLGEGPRWDAAAERLLWVDIDRSQLHVFDPETGDDDVKPVSGGLTAVAPMEGGGLLLAQNDRLAMMPPGGGQARELVRMPHGSDVRLNDGACDPAGRFWVGSMAIDERPDGGALYRYSAGEGLDVVVPVVGLSNGIGWSPDGSRMYYIDSHAYRLDVFDYDVASGEASARRTVVEIAGQDGIPDGLVVDDDGCIWVALWGGACLRRYTPDGRLDRTIAVPADNVTAACFAGAGGRSLYITTASVDLPPGAADQPLAGCVFVTDPGVSGPPAQSFAG